MANFVPQLRRVLATLFSILALAVGTSIPSGAYLDPVRLAEPFWVKVGDVLFKLPRGYLNTWPKPNTKDSPAVWGEFGFTFWMPELRFLETSPISAIGRRPKEKGRPEPPTTSYIVRVGLVHYVKDSDVSLVTSPNSQFSNTRRPDPFTVLDVSEEPFGLLRIVSPIPDQPFAFYGSAEGNDPQIFVRCPTEVQKLPYPSCGASVWFRSDNLTFYIAWPKEAIAEWKDVVVAVSQLVESWKLSP